MTHDPLCPYEPERRTPCTHGLDENGFATIESITTDMCQGERHYWPGVPCQCDLIAKVRDDERSRIADAVAENMIAYPYEYPSDYAEADRRWIKAGCPMPVEKP